MTRCFDERLMFARAGEEKARTSTRFVWIETKGCNVGDQFRTVGRMGALGEPDGGPVGRGGGAMR